jgi:hypothetical protein
MENGAKEDRTWRRCPSFCLLLSPLDVLDADQLDVSLSGEGVQRDSSLAWRGPPGCQHSVRLETKTGNS